MFPILVTLLMSGVIMVEHCQYIGLASDGALCVLGDTDNPERVERYLTDFPSPESW